MRSLLVLSVALLITVVLAGCGGGDLPSDDTAAPGDTGATPPPAAEAPSPVTFNTYLIALAPTDAEGEQIGCDDVLVATPRTATAEGVPLAAAYEVLFGTASTDSLRNSVEGLTVEEATLEDGIARIRLGGTLRLGGVCDHPRVEAQLRRTALQFAGVDSVAITVDGRPLEEILSMR